ncbi:MAG: hypothetical protein H6620_05655 [Halobacteriovoraceae bacterium]|nr:hypothetical protein [Halobacteriovoraceae bacterium]
MINVALMASGTGSIAEALYLKSLEHPELMNIPILITDKNMAPLHQRFSQYKNCEIHTIPFKGDKKQHEAKILEVLKQHNIHWVFLAGYMRLLSNNFIKHYRSEEKTHIVNIHPSLLPKYPGLKAYEKTFEANDPVGGISIHYVDEGMDSGPIISQKQFERFKDETLEDFMSRGKNLEKEHYPEIMLELMTLDSKKAVL